MNILVEVIFSLLGGRGLGEEYFLVYEIDTVENIGNFIGILSVIVLKRGSEESFIDNVFLVGFMWNLWV